MQEPAFWRERDRTSRYAAPLIRSLLTPFSMAYSFAGKYRLDKTQPETVGIPVICIGNLTVGGTGKTPLTTYIRDVLLADENIRVATLSRGYGGSMKDPVRVDVDQHTAADVGDEPLMMARTGENWVGKDRVAAAEAMEHAGVDLILLDDGFQNPTLAKSASILVIDSSAPFGNAFVFPKGPLREPIEQGIQRADIIILLGDGPIPTEIGGFAGQIMRARIVPHEAPHPGKYIAFAGIGRPEKFFDTLASFPDIEVVEGIPFPDHHVYSEGDLSYLRQLARTRVATLITTEKDYIRLPEKQRGKIHTLPVTISFDSSEDEARLKAALLAQLPSPK
ncbi:tetraacyldisaccharide 4'-kinase [Hirschia baltica]|uniref:Tetraacyldisaccharide 4'-kinase n=1 Tax=Hirschia baltica (strain ATCC 49814 / DSM 5838 / IFAM 1418) TaxID=582402 RepID=C6XQU1_HIRBI|nr:tetraacyldisaccharide 4'-kinase [Hirschia baltica]ACT58697.1 tetraacyldisaccharide 4'-kinase [Hirschia baltica ATCC 49814]